MRKLINITSLLLVSAICSHAPAAVTEQEANWLAERIGRDGQLHENEKALIAYMEALGAELPGSLAALIRPNAKAS